MVVMLYVPYPLSLPNIEDRLFERGIDICHEPVRLWWNLFGPLLAADIERQRISRMKGSTHWQWHLDEVFVMLRFRHMLGLQKFAPVHANVHNHFNSERHLVNRQTYKAARFAALAEWQNLMARTEPRVGHPPSIEGELQLD